MRIAIDTGGTFTDFIFVRAGHLEILKLPSTPRNPARAIATALEKILSRLSGEGREDLDLTCGTTVGTNALLERSGGRVALVTTAGFEDVIEIGRQARPRLYDFMVERPAPLVLAKRRIGLSERISAEGRVIVRPSTAEITRVLRRVKRSRADSIAVCFLFSFVNPAHERVVARRLRAEGFAVSVSHEIFPEFREYERTSTTVVNAYLVPVMSRYLTDMDGLARKQVRRNNPRSSARVRIMQSSGGIISAGAAAGEPVRTILSGPAGGILGAQYVARRAGLERCISFDMGGTSTDVSLIDGALRTTNESMAAGVPVAVPMLDIHTVGAGGGSIARFDRAGALRVGPESAGADPGPICYGRGERPTVTDAHLVLGHLPPEGLLGGEFRLDESRARRYMERTRGTIKAVEQFARGILDVVDATMEKAIRVISVQRGYDPRDYALVAFGGAGALHACALAAALEMPRVLVPKFPGALSALGILRADVVKEFSRTIFLPVASRRKCVRALEGEFRRLESRGFAEMRAENVPARSVRIERLLDMRYAGQSYELTVSAEGDFLAAFHRGHERRFGYADPARTAEIVSIVSRFTGKTPKPALPRSRAAGPSPRAALAGMRRAFFDGRRFQTPVYHREKLRTGNLFVGPAILTEYTATTLVPPGWRGRVDAFENLILEPRR
ncbi:MAG: hydantoinase/oxoprolinase family protein [Candidatus Acidiferrales bacterium]